jgi:glutamate--cysteine ligase
MASPQDEDERPLKSAADLSEVFREAEKPDGRQRIGAEAEKFGVFRDGRPLPYEGTASVLAIFADLERFGWQPERESEDGPVIALRRGSASITLEPGSQLELSGAALPDLHQVGAEIDQHLAELKDVSARLGLAWLGVGFQPIARQSDLGWVPKQRYTIMREYLPRKGSGAHDMMRRTATVQANFDYRSEADAMLKLCTSLRLSPILHAMTANAPFYERRSLGSKSVRGDVWLHMDPTRSGLIERVWRSPAPGYADYVEWALDSGMFLFKRRGRVIANTGQTFRSFLGDGYQGERATLGDWKLHLNTLFPEVRLKNTLELRSCDAQSRERQLSVVALMTGLLYDEHALGQAWALVADLDYDRVEADRPTLVRQGLAGTLAGQPLRSLALRTLEIARGGLQRRARLDAAGRDERVFLEPLARLLENDRCPADELLAGLEPNGELTAGELIARTELVL